jgi:hypothetical protein
MHREQQDVFLVSYPNQSDSHEPSLFQVKRRLRLLMNQVLNYVVTFRLGEVRNVDDLQVKWFGRRDYLNNLVIDDIERCPQSFVTPNDLAERSLQRHCIEFALQQDGAHKVVSRTAGLELIEEPEPLLRKRQRSHSALIAARNSFGVRGVDSLLTQ